MNSTLALSFELIYQFLQKVKGPIRRMAQEYAEPTQEYGALEICIYGGRNMKCFGATILRQKDKQELLPKEPLLLVFSDKRSLGPNISGINTNEIWMHYFEIPEKLKLPSHHSSPTTISQPLRNWLIEKIVSGKNVQDRLVEWIRVPYTIERNVTIEFKS